MKILLSPKTGRQVHPSTPHPCKQRGFTLLEVMISLVVLAIGVMGVIGMQVSTYQQLQTSHNYTQAAMIASNMADRMLANPAEALADNYDHEWDDGRPTEVNCLTVACSAAQLRDYDIFNWQFLVTGLEDEDDPATKTPGSLPGGSGEVDRDGTTTDFDITVRWDDDLSGSDELDCDTTEKDDLDCYVLRVRVRCPPAIAGCPP